MKPLARADSAASQVSRCARGEHRGIAHAANASASVTELPLWRANECFPVREILLRVHARREAELGRQAAEVERMVVLGLHALHVSQEVNEAFAIWLAS